MDCKGRSVDVLLAHCTGKRMSLTNVECDFSALPHVFLYHLCFLEASLIKAMTYYGNLDSEKPIFFESVSAAISHIHSNKVSWLSWPKGVIRIFRI